MKAQRFLCGLAVIVVASACELRPSREFVPVRSAQSGPPSGVVKSAAGSGEADPPSFASVEWEDIAADAIVSRRLSSGVTLHMVVRHDVPIASVMIAYGVQHVPSPATAARIYVGAALRGRAMPWSRQELQGATTSAFARPDWVGLGLTALAPVFEQVIERVVPAMMDASLWDIDFHDAKLSLIGVAAGDEPARRAYASALGGLFPPPHPYGASAGALLHDRLLEAKLAEVRGFRDAHHSTDNVVVAAAGSFDPATLEKALEKALEPIPRKPKVAPAPVPRPGGACAGATTGTPLAGTSQPYVAIAYPGVAAGHVDEAALDVLAAVLSGSLSSRLYSLLRTHHGASYGFGASNESMREAGAFVLRGDVDPGRARDAMTALDAELERLATTIVADDELRVAKTRAAYYHRFRDSGSAVVRLVDYAILGPSTVDTNRIRDVSAEQVRRAAERYLERTKRCVSIVGEEARHE